ncbi:hypothetical protein H4R19_001823 [Coemansia spiralis]|nr:hypothetical protein H4R19_001823 [Coemansia spiralis]
MAPRPSGEPHTLRVGHLHTAAHVAFKICPQLAGYYGAEFLAALGDQRASNTILRQHCAHCGVPLVDGRTVARVSVTSGGVRATQRRGAARRSSSKRRGCGSSAGRVVRIRPNEMHATDSGARPGKEERQAQLDDQKNTVEYTCAMCATRIVYPGATRTGLRAAGLDGRSGQPAAHPVPAVPSVPAATTALVAHSRPNQRAAGEAAAAAESQPSRGSDEAMPGIESSLAAKKRKRHKSNLLAVVAANKKKTEDKQSADSGAFNLSDFLSSL